MKKLIVSIILLVGIGLVVAPSTDADVSFTILSGTVEYGRMALNTSTSTIELNDMQTVTNNGDAAETFNIKGQNSADWTLADTPGPNQYVHKFCNETANNCSTEPDKYFPLSATGYTVLASDVPAGGSSVDFQLQITTPTVNTTTTEQHVDVTIQAVGP